jgi:hypothetical protein
MWRHVQQRPAKGDHRQHWVGFNHHRAGDRRHWVCRAAELLQKFQIGASESNIPCMEVLAGRLIIVNIIQGWNYIGMETFNDEKRSTWLIRKESR